MQKSVILTLVMPFYHRITLLEQRIIHLKHREFELREVRFKRLLHLHHIHTHHPSMNHAYLLGSCARKVNNAPLDEGPAIGYSYNDLFIVAQVFHFKVSSKGKCAVRTSQTVLTKHFTIACKPSMEEVGIVTGLTLLFVIFSRNANRANQQDKDNKTCFQVCFQHSI